MYHNLHLLRTFLAIMMIVSSVIAVSFSILVANATLAIASPMVPPTDSELFIIGFIPGATAAEKASVLASADAVVISQLPIIDGVAATMPASNLRLLQENPLVTAADPNTMITAKPLDLGGDQQIHADSAWSAGYTGSGVKIAILDEGLDQQHQEFSGRIAACHSEISGVDCNPNNSPLGWHGTAVTGMALAQGVYSQAKGVAPAAQIMMDKVFYPSNDSASIFTIVSGINWAVSNGAKVINLSLGSLTPSATQPNCDNDVPSMTTAINNAAASGVTVVAAAGNDGPGKGVEWPACISSTIAVGAVDSSNNLASFSNTGAAMADHGVVAKGVIVVSPYNGTATYANLSGTSFATPMVSGQIAIILQKYPNLTPSNVRQLVENSAQCLGSPCPNNNNFGYGVVNAYNPINWALSDSVNPNSENFGFCNMFGCTGCGNGSGTDGCFHVTSTLTVTSVNGFSGPVTLNYLGGGGSTSIGGPSSVNVAPGAPGTAILNIYAGSQTGTFQWSIQGVGYGAGYSTSTAYTITEQVCRTCQTPQT